VKSAKGSLGKEWAGGKKRVYSGDTHGVVSTEPELGENVPATSVALVGYNGARVHY
jgi:hypothetical protein